MKIVKAGSSTDYRTVEMVIKHGLGNFVYGVGNPEDAALCRRNKTYFVMPTLRYRPTLKITPQKPAFFKDAAGEIKKIKKAGGSYYMGLSALPEVGGLVYHPREYSLREPTYKQLPAAKDMAQAKQVYIDFLKKVISMERKIGGSPVFVVCSSALHKYHLEAGIDMAGLEVFPGDVNLLYSAIRGASRAYGRQWAAHVAMLCYGGPRPDGLWFKRWKTSLFYSFIAGADPVYMESGIFSLHDRSTWRKPGGKSKRFGLNSKECRRSRAILKDFYQFCQSHPRPENGPEVALGIVHGNLDGHGGLWNKWVWGQYGGDEWKHGAAECGWDYLESLYRKDEWFTNTLTGDMDYSGNPPYGQYDLVPVEAPPAVLKKYSCLVFLGWNTMTEEIYKKLKKYVKEGGHLIMSVPHLSTETKRSKNLKLYKKGDFRDLFGLIVKGKGKTLTAGTRFIAESTLKSYKFPNWGMSDPKFINEDLRLCNLKLTTARVLARFSTNYYKEEAKQYAPIMVENSVGKGKAFLITTWCYPGESGMKPFMKEILRDISIGEQGDIKLSGSDRIRYAVYEEGGLRTIYLLNTDFEAPQKTNLHIKKGTFPGISLKENELRIVYWRGKLVISPEDKSVHVESIEKRKNGYLVSLKGSGEQVIEMYYLGKRVPGKVEVNGRQVRHKTDTATRTVKLKVKLNRHKNVLKIK